jgi:hypothetical protein
MNSVSRHSVLLLIALLGAARAQQKSAQKPPTPGSNTPVVNCSEAQTSKACTSFKQLLDAHDTEIVNSLAKKPAYVCFRPTEDAFLIFNAEPPAKYSWEKAAVGEKQATYLPQLEEYRNGVHYGYKFGRGFWRRHGDEQPRFESDEQTTGRNKGLDIEIDGDEISIDYQSTNQHDGTTQYSLTIRRSTGRFIETFVADNTPTTTHSGTCLIYR